MVRSTLAASIRSFFLLFVFFFFFVGERLFGSPEEREFNYQRDPNSTRLCFVASLSLYDLYGFIGKHEDFQELLASQTHLRFLVGTGFYFPDQLKLVSRSLGLVNVKLMLTSTRRDEIFIVL